KNQIIDGHAPGLTGKPLQAYRAAGIDTEHEAENYEEAIEKLRAGFKLLIREGSAARNLEAILKGFVEHDIALDHCMFCTDDKHLEDIEKEGHIDFCVRRRSHCASLLPQLTKWLPIMPLAPITYMI